MSHYSGYMRRAFANRDAIVREAHDLFQNVEFDTFVGCGISGSLVAPLLADASNGKRNFAIVRKQVSSHGHYQIEGNIGRRWVFVDDFCATGDTFRYVANKIETEWPRETEFVGAYLYENYRFYSAEEMSNWYRF